MPQISSPEVMATHFNIFDHDAMKATSKAMGGIRDFAPVVTRDHSGGLAAQDLFRSPPVKHTLNLLALKVREQSLPKSVWWTGISHQFPQDFESNCYARLFADELTSYAAQYY